MSMFTNPFATQAVPVFASSPLNPLPGTTINNRRPSLVRSSPPAPSPEAVGPMASGIQFTSPFGPNPKASLHLQNPSPPARTARRTSYIGPAAGTPRAQSGSHSRPGSSDGTTSGSPASRRGSLHALPVVRSPAPSAHSPVGSPIPHPTSQMLSAPPVDFSRRKSVDVGVLGLGFRRSYGPGVSKNFRDAVGPDANDKEAGLTGAGPKGAKDRNVGRHLASILAHSLALCSESAPGAGAPTLSSAHPLSAIPASPISSPSSSRNPSLSAPSIATPTSGTTPFTPDTDESMEALREDIPAKPLNFPTLDEAKRFKLIGNLQSWSFNAMGYSSDELLSCVGIIFESVRNMEGVDFDMDRFRGLLLSLRAAYHARNGYHNFAHATDVTQACYSFLVRMGLAPPLYLLCEDDYDPSIGEGRRKWRRNRAVEEGGMGELLRPMDVFALMVAAIGHDVGHPGLSNAYMVNARTPVAQVYDDKSVLENFHTVTLVHMLRRHNFDYLLGGDFGRLGDKATSFRKILEASILATDMTRHFAFVNQINDMGRRFGDRRGGISTTIEEDRLLLCSGLIKCADISNPTRPHRISRAWSTALLQEWAVQASIETEFGLPVSVMCLDMSDRKAQAKSQVGFIDLFAKPLFTAMACVVDEFADFAEKLRDGRTAWDAISQQPDHEVRHRPSPVAPQPTKPWKLAPAPLGRERSRSSTSSQQDRDESPSSRLHEVMAQHSVPPPSSPPTTPSKNGIANTPRTRTSLSLSKSSHGMYRRGSADESSTSGSPMSPRFQPPPPMGMSSFSLGSTPAVVSISSFAERRTAPYEQLTCDGACEAATATCAACSKRKLLLSEERNKATLERALANMLRGEDDDDDESDDERIAEDMREWPPYPFQPELSRRTHHAAA